MKRSAPTERGSFKPVCVRRRPVQLPLQADGASTQVAPGVLLVDGCEVGASNIGRALVDGSGTFPPLNELSLNDVVDMSQDDDCADRFPDEILQNIFKYLWKATDSWNVAQVCKRWCTLQVSSLLQKQSKNTQFFPCHGPKILRQFPLGNRCNGQGTVLKLKKVESEWRLAMDLLQSCKLHTHQLEIKDCTHVSLRGYQLITGFASGLKSIRLESCRSMDDPLFDVILNRCPSLRSIHLTTVPKSTQLSSAPRLALRNIENNKSLKLQELRIHGCASMTAATVFSVLKGCPNLRTLGLSALGGSQDWDESKIEQGSPFKLQELELANTSAITDGFLQALAKHLPNLRRLDLSNCSRVSDDGLKAMIASCGEGLQRLVVTGCFKISDDSVQALAGVAANLKDVSLAGTNVTDEGLKAIMDSTSVLHKLRNLSVACCHRVTDAGLQHLLFREWYLRSLRNLDIQNCPAISWIGVASMRNSESKNWTIVSNLWMT